MTLWGKYCVLPRVTPAKLSLLKPWDELGQPHDGDKCSKIIAYVYMIGAVDILSDVTSDIIEADSDVS
jgi:hypothetical protein